MLKNDFLKGSSLGFYLLMPTLLLAVPNNPSALVLTPTTDSVALSWQDNAVDETGYKIFRNGTFLVALNPNTTSYTDTGLTEHTAYTYEVKATDDGHIDDVTIDSLAQSYSFQVHGSFLNQSQRYHIFLDSDNNSATGYTNNAQQVSGADYFIENNRLYSYQGADGSSSWHWTDLGLISGASITESLVSIPLNKEALGLGESFRYRLFTKAFDGHPYEVFPTNNMVAYLHERPLQIDIDTLDQGIDIASIRANGEEILHTQTPLFSLTIQNLQNHTDQTITAISGWENVSYVTNGDNQTVTLSAPLSEELPSTLEAVITINTSGTKSQWDLQVNGLGANHSLMNSSFPNLNLQPHANDTFFVPRYFGVAVPNPIENVEDVISLSFGSLLYPRGWGATMQYLAYYHDSQGLYFGFHDPKAFTKKFDVEVENGGMKLSCYTEAPNQTLADNNWDMPGHFELDLFSGEWYEAAQIYKTWVYQSAEYRPVDTAQRAARQEKIGSIGVWIQERIRGYGVLSEEARVRDFKDFMNEGGIDVPVGVHWAEWADFPFDLMYPKLFPALDNFPQMVTNLKGTYGDGLLLTAYFNGLLYDTENVATYQDEGFPSATKQADVTQVFTQRYSHLVDGGGEENVVFAVMCPTQTPWQDIIVDASVRFANMGLDGVYIDQVTASSPLPCMDPDHGHTLGGGNFWREGYHDMFSRAHAAISNEKYINSELANDYLVDQVDGFLTEMFIVNNQVPAFQAVYAGKVQFIGSHSAVGGYKASNDPDSQWFYASLAQSFSYGAQIGRLFMEPIISAQNERSQRARAYMKKLARLRVMHKAFFSFGEMKKPLTLTGDIPTIESLASKRNAFQPVVMPAISTSTWSDGTNILVSFVNAKVPQVADESITFGFDFDASIYGMDNIRIKEVTEDVNGAYTDVNNQFHRDVTLSSYDAKVFVISPR